MNAIADFLLRVPEGLKGEHARQFLFFRIGYWIGALAHLLFLQIFALNGDSFLTWYNVVVTGFFTLAGLYWRKFENPAGLFVLLFMIEIPLHALLGTLSAGSQTLFWIVPVASAVACLIMPEFSWPWRIVLSVSMVLFAGTAGILGFFVEPYSPMPRYLEIASFMTSFMAVCGVVSYVGFAQRLVQIAENRLTEEFDRAEGLLLNILPKSVAQRLKNGERVIADDYKEVSVVFADIVDFTVASAKLTPGQLVETLNTVFSRFDEIADSHGAEKIKTIGDAYMVVVGVPDSRRNHAEAAVDLAIEMQEAAELLSSRTHFRVQLRIGVNSGPVVAGVIGQRKFAYDLWGDAVNVASRMESHGEPGKILITEATAELLPERFEVRAQGKRDVKGKGRMPVFSVTLKG